MIEEVKKILQKVANVGGTDAISKMENMDTYLGIKAQQICQLFPKTADGYEPEWCKFEDDGECLALACYSSKKCGARDSLGNPIYKTEPKPDEGRQALKGKMSPKCPYLKVTRAYDDQFDEVYEGSICTFADKHCLIEAGEKYEVYNQWLEEQS